jgi:diguanylate cyclase (GGDEF)-like protein
MPVASLKEAAMRLGLRTVTSVALGFSVISDDRPETCPNFDYDLYWSASMACGLASQELSQRLGLATPAEAFTCALLSRIGQLALASCHPVEFSELLEQVQRDPNQSLRELETDRFGIDHTEIAEAMMFEWGLPSAFGEVARSLEDENGDQKLDGYARELWRVIRDGAIIASLCMQGDNPSANLVDDLIHLRQRLEVMGVNLTEVCDAVLRQWVEWGAMLSLPTKELASKLSPVNVLGSLARRREEHQALAQGEFCSLQATGIRVLAVDDDPLSLRLLEKLLREAGHEVFTAKNGREALALTLKVRPQVVVTDWQMPDIDGLEFCRALRRSRFGRRIYALLLTGKCNDEQILEAFDAGVDDYIVKPVKPLLFMARLRAGIRLVKLQEQVERDQAMQIKNATMMARMNRQLKEAANTDFLTLLPNRRCAMEQFQKEWRTALELGSPLSVLMMDIDYFKTVNDTYGHDTGDAVLRETARVIKMAVRRNDTAARMGGEEFLVICPGADLEESLMIGNRIRQRVEENQVSFGNFHCNVSISIGCAENLPGVQDIDHLLRLADGAVYASKSAGRNRVSAAPRPTPPGQAKSA